MAGWLAGWLVGWLVGWLAAFARSATEVKGGCYKAGAFRRARGGFRQKPLVD